MSDTLKSMNTFVQEWVQFGKSHKLLLGWIPFYASVAVIFLFIVTTIFPHNPFLITLEILFGFYFLFEYAIRLSTAESKLSFIVDPLSLLDVIVIISLFSSGVLSTLVFLRAVRPLQLLRFYRLFKNVGDRFHISEHRREILFNAFSVIVFLFIMTSLVYTFQVSSNPTINSYLDALYFSVTTVTTTGFGDITPSNAAGKILTIIIMVFGVSLFLKLAASMFKPRSIYSVCPNCGLSRHERDASHCRHCGHVIQNDFELPL